MQLVQRWVHISGRNDHDFLSRVPGRGTRNEPADVDSQSHAFDADQQVANPDEVLIVKVAVVNFDGESPFEVDGLH